MLLQSLQVQQLLLTFQGLFLYVQVLDQVNAAYNDVYGERVGLSANEFLQLDRDDPIQDKKYLAARQGIPRAISIAEPNKIAN